MYRRGTFLGSMQVMFYDVDDEKLLVAGRAESLVGEVPAEALVREAVASIFQDLHR